MRKGGREVLFCLAMFLLGTMASTRAARWEKGKPAGPDEPVGITIDLTWSAPAAGANAQPAGAERSPSEVVVSVSEGQVIEAVAWPTASRAAGNSPRQAEDGSWTLGSTDAGRIRARVEAAAGADLIVRRGDNVVRIPVLAIVDRPQRTPPHAPLVIGVERLPWDLLLAHLGPGAEHGMVQPSTAVQLFLQYNIITPEAPEATVRTTAALRAIGSDQVLWRSDQKDQVPANRLDPPTRVWTIPAPAVEGSYVLELRTSWEPAGPREGSSSRLARLIRRRKSAPATNSVTRRLVMVVASASADSSQTTFAAAPGGNAEVPPRETEVDSVEFGRIRGARVTAWGRAAVASPGSSLWSVPAEAILDNGRRERERDRLRNLIGRTPAELANLGPADDSGLPWSTVALRAPHPEKLHRLTLTVAAGDPRALGVALVDPGTGGSRPRLLLDACVAGPPILKDGPAATFSWLVWPGCSEPQLLLLNRSPSGPVRLGTVKLVELDKVPAGPSVRLPKPPATRALGLYLTGSHPLDRFGGGKEAGLTDDFQMARNLVGYVSYCGASLVVLPERLSGRADRRLLRGQAEEDSSAPDPLDVVLRLLRRQGCSAWLELNLDGPENLPGLPPPGTAEALRQGLVRVDRQGQPDGSCYHPLHPAVRQALKRRVEQALATRQAGGTVAGLLIQLGPGASLLGNPDTGLDDATYAQFVHDTFGPETASKIPGLETGDANRFASRSRYLSGVGRMPWLMWRSRAIANLYNELQEAARTVSPGAVLALSTPVLHCGAADAEARRVDLAGLAPSQAWRNVGLDLQAWPAGMDAPVLLRGVELSTDPLAHDLATSPDLDAKIAGRSLRGLCLTVDSGAGDLRPWIGAGRSVADTGDDDEEAEERAAGGQASPAAVSGPFAETGAAGLALAAVPLGDGITLDEPLGHAVAALDAQWLVLAAQAVAGHEEELRRFATVFRSLPAAAIELPAATADQKDCGVVARALGDASQTCLEIANDTPYPIRFAGLLDAPATASVEDLGADCDWFRRPSRAGGSS